MKKEFNLFFEEINKNQFENVWNAANIEKNKRIKTFFSTIVIVDILIFIFVITLMHQHISFFTIYFVLIFCFIIDVFIYLIIHFLVGNRKEKEYNNLYKEFIINELLKNSFEEVDYIPLKQMPESIYKEANYSGYYNRYFSDDYVDALIDNRYPIKLAEITTKEVTHHKDSHGHSHTSTRIIFSGLFAKIYLDKSIDCELRISQNNILYNTGNLKMDSKEFEDLFNVVSSNKIIAMQILTHDVMNLLVSFRRFLGYPFDILIRNNVIYIRLHVDSMFEAYVDKKTVINRSLVEKYYNILDFIETLSSNIIKILKDTQI